MCPCFYYCYHKCLLWGGVATQIASSPEASFDLTAAVHVAFVLHGQRQVPQVVQTNARVVRRHQDLTGVRKEKSLSDFI